MRGFHVKFSKSLSATCRRAALFLAGNFAQSLCRLIATPAGTVITNQAGATYESDGVTYSAISETVTSRVGSRDTYGYA